MKQRIKYGFIALGLVCLFFLLDVAIRGPKAKERQASIVEALRAIPDVSDASVTRSSSSGKTGFGVAERKLVSGLPVSEVRSFYKNKLEQQGWTPGCERFIGDRDRVVFVRNEDEAILDLPKADSQITGEYSLELWWGENYC